MLGLLCFLSGPSLFLPVCDYPQSGNEAVCGFTQMYDWTLAPCNVFLVRAKKREVWNEGRAVALVMQNRRDCWTVVKHFIQVCMCVCTECMGVSTCNWMLIFTYKGAYCNFSLWGFYDTVWQCFLAKLVAARHVLYYSSELCVHSWFIFIFFVRVFVKMIIWRELCLLRLLLDCDSDWFHSNWNKQMPMKRVCFLDCVTTMSK